MPRVPAARLTAACGPCGVAPEPHPVRVRVTCRVDLSLSPQLSVSLPLSPWPSPTHRGSESYSFSVSRRAEVWLGPILSLRELPGTPIPGGATAHAPGRRWRPGEGSRSAGHRPPHLGTCCLKAQRVTRRRPPHDASGSANAMQLAGATLRTKAHINLLLKMTVPMGHHARRRRPKGGGGEGTNRSAGVEPTAVSGLTHKPLNQTLMDGRKPRLRHSRESDRRNSNFQGLALPVQVRAPLSQL